MPITNPRHLVAEWSFGIQDENLQKMVDEVRAPSETRLSEKLAVSDGLLYRRGNFKGSWDPLICDALIRAA